MPPFPPENTPLSNPATEPTNQLIPPPVRQMANLNYSVPHLPTHLLRFGFPLCLTKKKKRSTQRTTKTCHPQPAKPAPPAKKKEKKNQTTTTTKKKCSTYFY